MIFRMSSVAAAILEHIPLALFQDEVVSPILASLTELLESLPNVFVANWPKFCMTSPKALPLEVICSGLLRALEKEAAVSHVDEDQSLALFVASVWIEENLAMYSFVEACLREKVGDFETVAVISESVSEELAAAVVAEFGPIKSFLFCVLSSVRLDPKSLKQLRDAAEEAFSSQRQEIDNLFRSCEMLETRALDSPSSPQIRTLLSRSLDDVGALREESPSVSVSFGRRRKGWQLMSQRDMVKLTPAGSHVVRKVHAVEKRGWLEKTKVILFVFVLCFIYLLQNSALI